MDVTSLKKAKVVSNGCAKESVLEKNLLGETRFLE